MERSVSARLTASTVGLKAALAEAGASVKTFAAQTSTAISSQRSSFSRLGTGLLAIGAAATAGFGLATREAIQWETAFAGVRKTVDDNAEGFARLERELRDMSLVLPASAVEIAGVAEAAGQLGVARANIVSFTKVMIELGNTTNLSANDAATGLARFMNIIGTAPGDVDRLGATLVDLGNKGASTEAEILAMGLRIAGIATIAHLSEQQVLGLANAMSSLGLDAEAGGTAISRVFRILDDAVKAGGVNLQTFAKISGVTAQQFAAAYRADPTDALLLFLDGLHATAEAGGSLTSALDSLGLADVRVSDTLTRLSADTDGVRASLDNAKTAWEENTALVEEAAKRYETTESKVQLARNALTDAGIDIGNKLLPMVAQLASALADLAGWFTGLNPAIQNTGLVLLGLVAAGGLVGGMALKIVSSLLPVISSLKGVEAASKAAALSMKALGAASIVVGVLAVAYGIKQLQEAMDTDKLKGDISDLAAELLRFSVTGKASGGAAKIFGQDLSGLKAEIARFATGGIKSFEDFSDTATDIGQVDQALAMLVQGGNAKQAADIIDQLGLSSGQATTIFGKYKAALDAIDTDKQVAGQAELERKASATTDEYGRLVDATGALIDPTLEMTTEAQHLADKWGLSAGAAIALADGIDAIVKATEEATDPTRDAQAANIAYESSLTDAKQTIKDLVEELKDSGGLASVLADTATGFDLTSVAGQALAQTALDIANNASANADAILATTNNTKDYREALQTGHDDLVAFYTDAGKSADEAQRLADNIIKVPDEVPITVPLTPLEAARLKAQEIVDALDAAASPRTATITVKAYWTDAAWQLAHLPAGTGDRTVGVPAGGRVAGAGAMGAESVGAGSFAQARGVGSAVWMAGGPGWAQQTQTQGRSAGSDRPPMTVDARTIINYPYKRESSEDTMRGLSKTAVFLASVGGPSMITGSVESR